MQSKIAILRVTITSIRYCREMILSIGARQIDVDPILNALESARQATLNLAKKLGATDAYRW